MKTLPVLLLVVLLLSGCASTPAVRGVQMHEENWVIDCGASSNGGRFLVGGFFDGVAAQNANQMLPLVCQSEQYGMSAFWMPLANGRYEIALTFCESYDGVTGAGERVFHATVEGVPVRDIDPYAQGGGLFKPSDRRVRVTVRDGKLDIAFDAEKQSPQINAIKITRLIDPQPLEVPVGFDQPRDLPRGRVTAITYPSGTAGYDRPANVYTPPAFDLTKQYPILILLHGGPGAPTAWRQWQELGHCGTILDNLIAEGHAQPMIVVMPLGTFHPPVRKSTDTQSEGPRARHELFERDLITDLLPYVEAHYPIRSGPESRALAGLSMGGGQVGWIGPRNTARFAYLGMFSAGLLGTTGEAVRNELPQGESINDQLRLLWVAVGNRDRFYPGVHQLADTLDAKGIQYQWHFHDGSHDWEVWRKDLYLFARRLFK